MTCLPSVLVTVALLIVSNPRTVAAIGECNGSLSEAETGYTVEWNVMGNDTVTFTVTADSSITNGGGEGTVWIGLGISNRTESPFDYPADAVVGLFFPFPGMDTIQDRFRFSGEAEPLIDQQNNIMTPTTSRDGPIFSLTFTRKFVTNDTAQDVSLDVPRYWLYALGTVIDGTLGEPDFTGLLQNEPIELPSSSQCSGEDATPVCESEMTSSSLYGAYTWPETEIGEVVELTCVHGAPFGIGSATASRACRINGTWAPNPDYSACRDSLPEVSVLPSNSIQVEIGRNVSIECSVTGIESNYDVMWFKVNGQGEYIPVVLLPGFNGNNLLMNEVSKKYSLAPNVSVTDSLFYVVLHNVESREVLPNLNLLMGNRLDLISWQFVTSNEEESQSLYSVGPSEDVSGMYVCRGTGDMGTRDSNITIRFEVPSPQAAFSQIYIRQTADFDSIFPFEQDLQFKVMESSFLEAIPIERAGLQTIDCKETPPRIKIPATEQEPVPASKRIECLIKEFPPTNTMVQLGNQVLNVYRNMSEAHSSNYSETGFCNLESTSDQLYGRYSWPESVGGQIVSIMCNVSNSNGYAVRNCLGSNEGWNTIIDYTGCRNVVTLSNPFEYYLRFSSANFSSSNASNDLSLNNIRITIELSSNSIFAAQCITIPKLSGDMEQLERVECRINGTSENQAEFESSQQAVVDNLIAQALLVPGTDSSNAIGFCDAKSTVGPEGTTQWPESVIGTTIALSCPLGPTNATITRRCVSQLNWTTPDATSCATTTTLGLQALNESLNEINTGNVAQFTNNLTQLVSGSSISVADQTTQNSQIVSDVFVRTSVLIESPNVTLQDTIMITTDIVVILDNVEEWPQENTQNQNPTIITAFESVTTSLVQKDNFTNLTVVTDDIVLVAERVNVNSIEEEGRTFVVNEENGALEVNRNSQTNPSLQEDQPAIFTFPSGIDLQELVMDNNNGDDVGIFFVIYEEDTLFTVIEEEQDPVGSAVVSFTIAGLPSGTTLPQPISINLRIANPITRTTENITDATCVFYNFTTLRWDPTGCETIYDPDVNPDEVLCRCSHLTNFASLVDISSRVGDGPPPLTVEQRVALEVISYIGVVLSLVGLLATIITLLIFKKIRERDVTKFHLQLCIALVCMYIVFVSGIDSTDNRGGCITVGVMIHYFSLVAWMWMGAEALLMFQKLIIVFGKTTWKYILFISVLCWSIPVVPVIISVSVDPDHYITTYNDNTTRSGFCFISHVGVFFGAFFAPILLVIVFNTIIYALVIRVLVNHVLGKNKFKVDKQSVTPLDVFKLTLSIVGIMFLFGLSWIFAVFTFIATNRDVSFGLQFLFAFFNTLQGFWIFFFFVFLNSEARELWKALVLRNHHKLDLSSTANKSSGKYSTTSSSKASKRNDIDTSTGDSAGNIYLTAPVKYIEAGEKEPVTTSEEEESTCNKLPEKDEEATAMAAKEKEIEEAEKETKFDKNEV